MVTILLATLNGEDYLKAQLESIAAQTYENWQLVVGDDGSTDGTISILEEFSKQYPEQVTIIKNDPPQGSAKDNFISLIQNSYGPADLRRYDHFWRSWSGRRSKSRIRWRSKDQRSTETRI